MSVVNDGLQIMSQPGGHLNAKIRGGEDIESHQLVYVERMKKNFAAKETQNWLGKVQVVGRPVVFLLRPVESTSKSNPSFFTNTSITVLITMTVCFGERDRIYKKLKSARYFLPALFCEKTEESFVS